MIAKVISELSPFLYLHVRFFQKLAPDPQVGSQ